MYTILAVAPCSFTVSGQHFSLNAGEVITVQPSIGRTILSTRFEYHSYLRLIEAIEAPKPAQNPKIAEKVANEKAILTAQAVITPPSVDDAIIEAQLKLANKMAKMAEPATMPQPKPEPEPKSEPVLISEPEPLAITEVGMSMPEEEEAEDTKKKAKRGSKKKVDVIDIPTLELE